MESTLSSITYVSLFKYVMPTSTFLQNNSKVIENVLEHGFISDISCELLRRKNPQILDVLRADVDRNGIDLVLSVDATTHHIQMKARVTKPLATSYDIADLIWSNSSGCVIWIIYDGSTMKPISYYLLGVPLAPLLSFPASTRSKHRKIWTRNANHKKLSLTELTDILFPI